MTEFLRRTNEEVEAVYARNIDTVYRVCFSFMKNSWDTEDAVQTTFVRLLQSDKTFNDFEHEKAWFIVTASNICKDQLKFWWRRNIPLNENTISSHKDFEIDETFEVILSLPNKYKTPIYLYYYEGYNGQEIADLLNISAATIRSQLRRGRAMLQKKIEIIEGDLDEK